VHDGMLLNLVRPSENSVTHELELRRIPLPRTPVNNGKKKDRGAKPRP